jgi:hypothetical protein
MHNNSLAIVVLQQDMVDLNEPVDYQFDDLDILLYVLDVLVIVCILLEPPVCQCVDCLRLLWFAVSSGRLDLAEVKDEIGRAHV